MINIDDRIYELVAQKQESDPKYTQSRHDIYGVCRRAMREYDDVLKAGHNQTFSGVDNILSNFKKTTSKKRNFGMIKHE